LKQDKCTFMQSSVKYLGYKVDQEGIHPLKDKEVAIVDAPESRNIKELRAILGLVNYYGKFIKQLATIAHPLNQLLCKGKMWKWDSICKEAFQLLKSQLASSDVLVYYGPLFTNKARL